MRIRPGFLRGFSIWWTARSTFAIGDLDTFGGEPYARPFKLVVDKDNRSEGLNAAAPHQYQPPSAEEFEECLNWFAAAALMQARLIARRDPWAAKYRDWDLKQQLLRMIVWAHRCRHGWNYDTWFNGKNINDWADVGIRDELDPCWAGVRPEEMVQALLASMDLFERVAVRTARALDLPSFHHGRVQAEVGRILALTDAR